LVDGFIHTRGAATKSARSAHFTSFLVLKPARTKTATNTSENRLVSVIGRYIRVNV